MPKVEDLRDYVEFRLEEAIAELNLAVELLKRGYSRNAAQKAFMAWKAVASALVSLNLDKMPRDEKEREWIEKRTHTVPTHSMYAVARILKGVGVDITDLTTYAIDLHDYQYNGFELGFSKYSRREDVLADLLRVVKEAWTS